MIRPSNLFGMPKEMTAFARWTLAPFDFCRQAVTSGRIVLKTAGEQQRNFVHVEDVSRVIEQAIAARDIPALLHVPGPETVRIRDLASLVIQTMAREFEREVQLVAPEATGATVPFQFRSTWLETTHSDHTLQGFVRQLCGRLLE